MARYELKPGPNSRRELGPNDFKLEPGQPRRKGDRPPDTRRFDYINHNHNAAGYSVRTYVKQPHWSRAFDAYAPLTPEQHAEIFPLVKQSHDWTEMGLAAEAKREAAFDALDEIAKRPEHQAKFAELEAKVQKRAQEYWDKHMMPVKEVDPPTFIELHANRPVLEPYLRDLRHVSFSDTSTPMQVGDLLSGMLAEVRPGDKIYKIASSEFAKSVIFVLVSPNEEEAFQDAVVMMKRKVTELAGKKMKRTLSQGQP